jgi:tripartite-type tricarboxylate transporter receptor subunit TctC
MAAPAQSARCIRLSRRALPLLGAAALPARAQPASIRLIAPFPPGGSVDTIARLLAPGLQERLGQPVIVENRSGAAGAIGTLAVARAAPDGQTWLLAFDSHATVNAINPDAGFDAVRDFTPVMLVATAPMILATPTARPWPDLAGLLAAARVAPDRLTYGTVGNGSLAHLLMEEVQQRSAIRLVHVPYRGGGPLSAAAIAGEVDLAVASSGGLAGQLGGRLRGLAQSGARRSPTLPNLPTLSEADLPGLEAEAFWGVLGPAGLSAMAVARMQAALAATLAEPATRRRLTEGQGVEIIASSAAEFALFLAAQTARWGALIRARGIRAE